MYRPTWLPQGLASASAASLDTRQWQFISDMIHSECVINSQNDNRYACLMKVCGSRALRYRVMCMLQTMLATFHRKALECSALALHYGCNKPQVLLQHHKLVGDAYPHWLVTHLRGKSSSADLQSIYDRLLSTAEYFFFLCDQTHWLASSHG